MHSKYEQGAPRVEFIGPPEMASWMTCQQPCNETPLHCEALRQGPPRGERVRVIT